MGVKINVGYCQKIGLPNYGSEGAHCDLEIEVDASVFGDPEAFQNRLREVYATCRKAVQMELEHRKQDAARSAERNTEHHESRVTHAETTGQTYRKPSPKQSKYAEQLAAQVKGLGVRKLDNLCVRMYQKPFAALSGLETSNLIDTLREAKAGRLDLAAV